jgi:peptidyl-prolyl cis-trans isomerase B (cyclophilin B)
VTSMKFSFKSPLGRTTMALLTGALLVGVTACGSGSSGSTASTTAAAKSSTVAAPSPSAAPAGFMNCDYTPGGKTAKQVDPPDAQEPTTGAATATIALGQGPVTIELDRATAPCTVGSFVHLAEAGYFDNTPCHRLTGSSTLSVLQCGDPSGTGSGGPGYTYGDETTPSMTYPAGTMANAGHDTNGSQFFLVYSDSTLPPDYTVFGTITGGLDVIQGIAAKGITGSGNATKPVEPVTISTVTVAG